MNTIPFSLNSVVCLKLTEYGYQVWHKHYADVLQEYTPLSIEDRRAKADKNGYVQMQLWTVMQIFGPHIGLGLAGVIDKKMLLQVETPTVSVSDTPSFLNRPFDYA